MNDKLIRQITGEIAEALVSRKLAAIPNRKAAQALLKSWSCAPRSWSVSVPRDRRRGGSPLSISMCAG